MLGLHPNSVIRILLRWTELDLADFAERYDVDYHSLWLWERDLATPPDDVVERLEIEVARDFPDD